MTLVAGVYLWMMAPTCDSREGEFLNSNSRHVVAIQHSYWLKEIGTQNIKIKDLNIKVTLNR